MANRANVAVWFTAVKFFFAIMASYIERRSFSTLLKNPPLKHRWAHQDQANFA